MTEMKLNQTGQQQQQQSATSGGTSAIPSNANNGMHHRLESFKKSQSVMVPVYRLVGINDQPKPKELGTLILLGVFMILLIISVIGFWIMWLTNTYNNFYVTQLVLANNSEAAELWENSPIRPHIKVHIFNYTNIDRYLQGLDSKIHVNDLGPYTYEETSSKVNVIYNKNFTVTYKDHRAYKFLPELSNGMENDLINIPNVPLMTASVKLDGMNFFVKSMATTAIKSMTLSPFKKIEASQILWGYDDELITLSQYIQSDNGKKFGMLINRNGTSKDTLQIHTGVNDLRKLGIISEFNGANKLDFWASDKCNQVDGTDGSQFPPHLMDKEKQLEVFLPAFCRKLPLQFEREIMLFDDVPAWRYRTPTNVFATPDINPENTCYCDQSSGNCPQNGLSNGTRCYGAPIYPSFPHFFSGDPKLWSQFEGIKPIKELHQTFADIHPRLAFPINGASRIQINIELHKGTLLKGEHLKRLEDGIVLPVLWIEVTSGELTEGVRNFIYYTTVISSRIQFALKYGTLLTCVILLALLIAGFYYLSNSKDAQQKDNEKSSIKAKDPSELEALNQTIPYKIQNDFVNIQI